MTDRRTIAEALLFQGNKLVTAGLVVGSGGNLSGRLPDGEGFLITPSGYSLAELTPEQLSVVGLDGSIAEGQLKPSSEWPMHAAAYNARPDAEYVFHLHPPLSTTLHAIGQPIRHLTTDHAQRLQPCRTDPGAGQGCRGAA
jgi:L-fuculose-phosphate aldolase